MKLNIVDRLQLVGILPMEGDIVNLRIGWELRNRLGLTSEEVEKHDVKDVGAGKVSWDPETKMEDTEKEFDFSPPELGLICEAFKKLSDSKKLSFMHVHIHDKFMLPNPDAVAKPVLVSKNKAAAEAAAD